MTTAVELAQIWVPLMPEASKLAQGVEKIGRDAEQRFGRATKVMGGQMASSFTSASRKVVESLRDIEKHTTSVAKANKVNEDALGRLTVAQVRQQQVSANAKATEAQRAAAIETVNRLERAQTITADNLTAATKKLTTAQATQIAAQKSLATGRPMAAVMPLGGDMAATAERAGTESGSRFVTGFKRVLGAGAALAIGGGFIAGVKSAVMAGVDMETNLNRLQGVTSATAAEMKNASDIAHQLGADTTIVGASAADAAAAMLELAKGGLTMQQALAAAPGTLRLAAAAQIDAATAAESQATILNSFQLGADQANRVADALANVANAAQGEVPDFMLGMQQASAVAHGFGISMEDTVAVLGLFAKAGIRGSDAGTSLKTMLTHIANPSDQASAAMDELSLSLHNAQGEFVGMPEMFRQIGEAANHMRPDDFQRAAATVFGTDAIRGAMIAGNQGVDTLNQMGEAVRKLGGADKMAAANMQGVPGTLEKISNAADGAKLSFYELIKPMVQAGGEKLVPLLQSVATVFDKLKDGGNNGGLRIIGAAWSDIASAAKDLAPAAAQAVKALAVGAGTVVVSGWTALAAAVKVLEPPLKLVANILGDNQWLSTGLMAGIALFVAKAKLLPPVINGVNNVIGRTRSIVADLTGPLSDVTDKTTGLVTQQGLYTRQAQGTLGPLGQMRAAYVDGSTKAKDFAKSNQLSTQYAKDLRDQMIQGLGPMGRMRQAAADAGGAIRGMSPVVGGAKAAMSGLSIAGGGLLSMLGGPWGVAIMGLTGAMALVGQAHADAAAKAEAQREAEVRLQQTLDATTGRTTEQTRKEAADRFGVVDKYGTSDIGRARDYGVDPKLLVDAATRTGNQQAYDIIKARAAQGVSDGISAGQIPTDMAAELQKMGVSRDQLTNALVREGNGWNIVNTAIQDYNSKQRDANKDYKPMIEGLQTLIDVMPDGAESIITMAQNVNELRRQNTKGAESQRALTEAQFGTWKATAEGAARFKNLGAAILDVPTGTEVVVNVLDDAARKTLTDLGYTVDRLPDGTVKVVAATDEAKARFTQLVEQIEGTTPEVKIRVAIDDYNSQLQQWIRNVQMGVDPGAMPSMKLPGRAGGGHVSPSGRISGPGSGTSDHIIARVLGGGAIAVSNGESINTESSTRRNWSLIDAMNKGWTPPLGMLRGMVPGFSGGGLLDLTDAADAMAGTPYSQDLRNDCSGSIAKLVNVALGDMGGGLMTTQSAEEWLAQRGFQRGTGPAGSFQVGWYNHGSGTNDGHMAATLPDGRNVESGGKNGIFTVGAGAAGASDSQFDQHMYLPMDAMYPEGSGGGGGGGFGGGGAGGSGGGGGYSSGPTGAEQRALRNATQKIDDTAKSIETAQKHLDELPANAKDSTRNAAQDRLDKAKREHQDALDDEASMQEEVNQRVSDRGARNAERGGKDGRGGAPDLKSFGKDMLGGVFEMFGLDGSVFSNPMEWGIWKLFTGGANYVGGLLKNAFGGPDAKQGQGYWGQKGDGNPNRTQHGLGGSPGPGNFSDGGFGGGDGGGGGGGAVADTLGSLLPNVSDFLPNSQTGGDNITTNQNSNNSSSTGAVFNGPVTINDPNRVVKPPDRIESAASGLPR